MSKRKRDKDFEDGLREEDNCSPGIKKREEFDDLKKKGEDSSHKTSNDPPNPRKLIYKEVYQEIRKCQEAIKVVKHKIEQQSHDVEDFYYEDSISFIEKANNQLEDALTSLEKSSRHWVSFLAIPEVPMRHILKYLEFKDKANFRLSSQIHRQIVDWFDIDFKTVKIDPSKFDKLEVSEMLRTGKDIKLKNYNHMHFDIELLPDISDRLVELKGPPMYILNQISSPEKLEKVSLAGQGIYSTDAVICVRDLASNLRVLTLVSLDLSFLKDQIIQLSNLEKLELVHVTGFASVAQLLTCSSTSLKHFALRCDCTGWDFAGLNKIVMRRLEKMEIAIKSDNTGIFNLLKFASRSLKALLLNHLYGSKDRFPVQPDLCFPNLEWLYVSECNSDFLSILTCSAPKLNKIMLSDNSMNRNFSKQIVLNPLPAITKLEINSATGATDSEGLNRILAAVATSIEELDINRVRTFAGLSNCNSFPKLRKLYVNHCDSEMRNGILRRSPGLQDLDLGQFGEFSDDFGHADLSRVEKLTIRNVQILIDYDPVNLMLSKVADSLKELTIFRIGLPMLEVKQLKLTKLSLDECSNTAGLCDLLNACRSTLEELEILDSKEKDFLSLQGLQVMTVLKKITIQFFYGDGYKNMISSDALNALLKQSSKSLEKLVLDLPYEAKEPLNRHILTLDLNLPNLKILQIYPRPADRVLKQISLQLPKDVTFWFFRKFTCLPSSYPSDRLEQQS